jgi:hypothetical protein
MSSIRWSRPLPLLLGVLALTGCNDGNQARSPASGTITDPVAAGAAETIDDGRRIFRFDTFGDEVHWTDRLKLHQAMAGVSPELALTVGLKVDVEALPAELQTQLRNGQVDLTSPATTVALLELNAVVGVAGKLNPDRSLQSIGVTCAICHSTVDDSFAPGIGRRLDGWPNRDLNVGAIISLAPDLSVYTDLLGVGEEAVRGVLMSWGPGKFDAELILDGKGFRPDGKSAATLIPPAFGLTGVNLSTWTGWGSLTYWNAFVANLEMGGQGTFWDPRLDDATKFPVAARARLSNVRDTQDLVTPKLAALHFYQLALDAPTPPPGSFDAAATEQGRALFEGRARCATCHVPPLFTEPGWNMHTASEIGIDDFQALRSPDERYRTAPLRGLFAHQKGGFYHDGRFPTLADVVNHYDTFQSLGLDEAEKAALVEYLKSL